MVIGISCNFDNSNINKDIPVNRIIEKNNDESINNTKQIIEDISDSTVIKKFITHEEFYCPDHKYKGLKVKKSIQKHMIFHINVWM
ncbi:MAG: hypothetical protein M0D57_14370 [Sphingobacteriales bacterium JAD_PAG50586_3]|nr:MAG: hypothetical protein M0D57_14370 [Sphingobacteriales bacterium JAD_PAG50586_3]